MWERPRPRPLTPQLEALASEGDNCLRSEKYLNLLVYLHAGNPNRYLTLGRRAKERQKVMKKSKGEVPLQVATRQGRGKRKKLHRPNRKLSRLELKKKRYY